MSIGIKSHLSHAPPLVLYIAVLTLHRKYNEGVSEGFDFDQIDKM
jgi:hypothetical protein